MDADKLFTAQFKATTGGGGDAPGAVVNFTATAGDKQVALSWETPANNGGSAITGYEVTRDNWANKEVKTASQLSHTYPELTNGTEYTFKVRALNANGAGAESTKTATPKADDGGKKYVTYNKPVTAYYIEFSDGTIDANKGKFDRGNPVIEAYENKKYSEIYWGLMIGSDEQWVIEATAANGTVMYTEYLDDEELQFEWFTDSESADPEHDNSIDWRTEDYKMYEYPLGNFAAWVSAYKGYEQNIIKETDLWYLAQSPDVYALPNQKDVTELYVKNETVCGIVCDVYQDTFDTYAYTFWVNPATGFTLKFEQRSTSDNSIVESYEVTKIVVGSPDWDDLHLHFREGDTLTNLHQ
jgi:hypothetical protein